MRLSRRSELMTDKLLDSEESAVLVDVTSAYSVISSYLRKYRPNRALSCRYACKRWFVNAILDQIKIEKEK